MGAAEVFFELTGGATVLAPFLIRVLPNEEPCSTLVAEVVGITRC